MKNKYEIDMSVGNLFSKIVRFAIPVMISGILQLAFNAADLIVVGRFCGDNSLAAVGSNGALVSLIVTILLGMGTGTSVLASRYYGAKDAKALKDIVSTTMILGLVGGIVFAFIGVFLAEPLLVLMGTPEEVLPLAAIYLRIYFAGLPVIVLYNFSSAILKAVGDSRRPLYYLAIAGVLNVGMNVFFVTVLDMDVAGVAIATVASQCVSCVLTLLAIIRTNGMYKLDLRDLHFSMPAFKQIVRIGLPAGLQNSLFSISNVLIQSSVNSFGAIIMAGNSAASSIEAFLFTSVDAVNQSAIASVSQNMGAREYKRTTKATLYCGLINMILWIVMGGGFLLIKEFLLGIYTSDPEVIAAGCVRMNIMAGFFILNGLQHMLAGVIRGHGYSMAPTIVSLLGICGFRVFWIYVVFASNRTLSMLYTSYPVSWIITLAAMIVCYFLIRKKAWAANEARMISAEQQHTE